MMHTLADVVKFVPALTPAARTAAATSAAVDAAGTYGVTAVVFIASHDRSDGNEVLTVKLQESADGSSWTDIPGAQVVIGNFVPTANVGDVFLVSARNKKRFVRVVGTPAGTTPNDLYGVMLAFTGVGDKPAAQENEPVKV